MGKIEEIPPLYDIISLVPKIRRTSSSVLCEVVTEVPEVVGGQGITILVSSKAKSPKEV